MSKPLQVTFINPNTDPDAILAVLAHILAEAVYNRLKIEGIEAGSIDGSNAEELQCS